MEKTTLVVLAAGMGSRYGGLKQVDAVDERGHVIMDYSIYDACRAGFDKIVCVIRPEHREVFHQALGERIARKANFAYAFQSLDMLPEGFSVPEGRVKPWGTGHAALCAAGEVEGSFTVINADDFYGREAFQKMHDFLVSGDSAHCMVGYRVENTLTENGSVSRGVCAADENGDLVEVVERVKIVPRPGGAAYLEEGGETFLPAGTIVSMNFWGFRPSVLPDMRRYFVDFLREKLPKNPEKAEFYLPDTPNRLVKEGLARVRVLDTAAKWHGVTYKEDKPGVVAAIAKLRESGEYPDLLWE